MPVRLHLVGALLCMGTLPAVDIMGEHGGRDGQVDPIKRNAPSGGGDLGKDRTRRPNILFILADDLGYGELGCYGQKRIQTPCLDRMAQEGMRFTRHFAGAPVCGPSRACLMTGQSQAIGYIKGNPGGLPERENLRKQDRTVAEVLSDAGYKTACIGKWGLGPAGMSGYPTSKGFQAFLGYDTHRSAHNYYPKRLCDGEGYRELDPGTYSHDVFAQEALRFIGQDHAKPWFLYLAFTIPHSPYDPPSIEPYADRDWPETYKKYAAMITRMDKDVGRLLTALKESGQEKNTLIIFTSDNGPQSKYRDGESAMTRFFESNGVHRGIKRDVFNGGVIEPFIARWSGTIAAGSISDHVSAFQDFMPTACDLAGAACPAESDGISYLPTLLGSPDIQVSHKRLYWEFISMGKAGYSGRQSMLDVERNVKAVRFGRTDKVRVYDLADDAKEAVDLAESRPDLAASCSTYLDSCRTPSALWPKSMLERGWMVPQAATDARPRRRRR